MDVVFLVMNWSSIIHHSFKSNNFLALTLLESTFPLNKNRDVTLKQPNIPNFLSKYLSSSSHILKAFMRPRNILDA